MKKPKYTHGYINRHGKPCFYLRRPGHKKVRLPGLPWSPEFMAAREAALNGEWIKPEMGSGLRRIVAGTVNAAIVSYYQTSAFKDGLAESSQKMRRAILERFREEHGDKRIALMHKGALQTILDKKSPAAASNWRKALRGLIDHAMSLNMLATDPLAGVKLIAGQVKRVIIRGSRRSARDSRRTMPWERASGWLTSCCCRSDIPAATSSGWDASTSAMGCCRCNGRKPRSRST